MNSFFRYTVLLVLMIVLISGCTRKNNLTGDNWSDIRPQVFTDSLFTLGFSYGDTVKVSGFEGSLLAGNYGGAEAVAMMRFTGLPETTTLAAVSEAKLTLTLKRRSAEPRNPLTLEFKKLLWPWTADSTFAIADTSLIASGIEPFVVPNVPVGTDSTLTITLPAALIQNWKHSGSTGLNLAIKTDEGGFAEFYSIDSGTQGPKLSFKYRLTTDSATATMKTFESYAISDSYRVDTTISPVEANRWIFRNISPSRIFAKFAINNSKFRNMQGAALDSVALKRVTINRAELIFYVKNNPYYSNNTNYSLRAFNVTRDSINSAQYLASSDYQLLSLSSISSGRITADSVVVNITPMVQGYVSGDLENLGIMIRSLQEMQNFGELELWHFLDAPAGKKPYIRVRYTTPYL